VKKILVVAAFSIFALGMFTGQSMTAQATQIVYRPVVETLSPLDMMRAAGGLPVVTVENAV
jgi:hypothetical protein